MATISGNLSTLQTVSVTKSASESYAVTGPINLTNGLAPAQVNIVLTGGGPDPSTIIEYTKDNVEWITAPYFASENGFGPVKTSCTLGLSLYLPSKDEYPGAPAFLTKKPIIKDGEVGLLAAAGATSIRARIGGIGATSVVVTFFYLTIT